MATRKQRTRIKRRKAGLSVKIARQRGSINERNFAKSQPIMTATLAERERRKAEFLSPFGIAWK